MKKIMMTAALMAFMGISISAGRAMALPSSADYWKVTDATTGIDGSIDSKTNVAGTAGASLFALLDMSYFNRDVVGSFGLYYDLDQDQVINPATEHYQVIDGAVQLPVERDPSTFFHFNSGTSSWEVAAEDVWAPGYSGAVTPMIFSNVFGFYFSGAQAPISYFYTDSFFNGGVEFITIDYSPYKAAISFDYNNNGTVDAIVKTDDVAPVPEPASMLLLGTGLVGLASASRKRMKKA